MNRDAPHPPVHPGFGQGVQSVIEPVKEPPQTVRTRLPPVMLQIGSVTEMRGGNVSKAQVAANKLHKVETNATTEAVPPVTYRRKNMECHEDKSCRACWRRDANPADPAWAGVFEASRKDG